MATSIVPFVSVALLCQIAYVLAASPHSVGHAIPGLIAVGGKTASAHNGVSTAFTYNAHTNGWKAIGEMITPRRKLGLADVQGKVFAAGGATGNHTVLNTVEQLDREANRWHMVAPMNQKRCQHGLIGLSGTPFAFGGVDQLGAVLSNAEYYDGHDWHHIFNMSVPRRAMGATKVDYHTSTKCIYAIGGTSKRGNGFPLASGEKLCLHAKKWQPIAPMHQARYFFAAAITVFRGPVGHPDWCSLIPIDEESPVCQTVVPYSPWFTLYAHPRAVSDAPHKLFS